MTRAPRCVLYVIIKRDAWNYWYVQFWPCIQLYLDAENVFGVTDYIDVSSDHVRTDDLTSLGGMCFGIILYHYVPGDNPWHDQCPIHGVGSGASVSQPGYQVGSEFQVSFGFNYHIYVKVHNWI